MSNSAKLSYSIATLSLALRSATALILRACEKTSSVSGVMHNHFVCWEWKGMGEWRPRAASLT